MRTHRKGLKKGLERLPALLRESTGRLQGEYTAAAVS